MYMSTIIGVIDINDMIIDIIIGIIIGTTIDTIVDILVIIDIISGIINLIIAIIDIIGITGIMDHTPDVRGGGAIDSLRRASRVDMTAS